MLRKEHPAPISTVPPPEAAETTDPSRGLTEAEAAGRRAQGLGHDLKMESSRSLEQIVRDNLLTFLNVTLLGIGLILIILGLPKDAFLSSGLVVINAGAGIWQELRAKRRLDHIALLNRVKATVVRDGEPRAVDPNELVVGDILRVRAGDQIMLDGRIVGDGAMDVDESLLTGETDVVSRQPGDPVYSGSYCVSGAAAYQAEKVGLQTRAAGIVAGARAYRVALTPLQHDVNLIIRLLLVIAGSFLAMLLLGSAIWKYPFRETVLSAAVVLGIVPSGLFLMITITYSLAAVRLSKQNALIQQTNAIESLSNVNVFCMDKTGTLTANRLILAEVQPIADGEAGDEARLRAELGVVAHSGRAGNKTSEAIAAACAGEAVAPGDEIPFSSARKRSALAADTPALRGTFALGAPEMLGRLLPAAPPPPPPGWADRGLRVLLYAASPVPARLHDGRGEPALPPDLAPAAWLGFSDELRPQSRETLEGFRNAGITLKIISGDNPETVAALARQAGLPADAELVSGLDLAEMDDGQFDAVAGSGTIFGRITPEQKERLVDALRRQGHYIAMTGDGVNDVLSLKKAYLAIAMESGSQATRSAADIVLLKDSFAVLPSAFREGQRIRMGLQGVLGLFLVRVFVVALLILMSAVVQAGFPFSPGHISLLTTLTVGIPTFGLAFWAHPELPPKSLLRSLLSFVLPAVLTLAVASFAIYTLFFFLHDVQLVQEPGGIAGEILDAGSNLMARDALTYVLILAGIILVPFAAPPNDWFAVIERTHHDWRPTLLALAMLPAYAVIITSRPLRDFFGLSLMSALDYLLIALAAILWALVLRQAYRTSAIERFFGFAEHPAPRMAVPPGRDPA